MSFKYNVFTDTTMVMTRKIALYDRASAVHDMESEKGKAVDRSSGMIDLEY